MTICTRTGDHPYMRIPDSVWAADFAHLSPAPGEVFHFGENILLPDEGYDLPGRWYLYGVRNLRYLREVSIFGGPTIYLVEKIDSTSQSYAVYCNSESNEYMVVSL